MIRLGVLLGAMLFSGCVPTGLVALIVAGGIAGEPRKGELLPPERDFFTSGRPIAVRELRCERVRPLRIDDAHFMVQGCEQRAAYVLVEGAPAPRWTREGDIVSVPSQPLPLVEAVGRCDQIEVADLTQAGVSVSAIRSACDDAS